jgi:hypothetical protein
MNRILSNVVMSILAVSCAASKSDVSVKTALKSAATYDGLRVTVRGHLSSRHSFLNLFSQNGQQCLGLIPADDEIASLRAEEGRNVSISGVLRAEGCGREGICDEHICGPAVLTDVIVLNDNRLR